MRALEDADLRRSELNRDLAREDDPARVRFVASGPFWHEDDDRWRILAFWEFPEPEGSVWPTETLWRYRHRIRELFEGHDVAVASYFRTREELESGEYHTGWSVPELA